MDKKQALERKIQRIKEELMEIGEMRPGSLSVQTRRWGGQYHQLSYTHQGKGHTEYVPDEKRKEVEQQIDNYRKFRELVKNWVNLGIELCKLKSNAGKPKS
ncbi:MAG: DUF6788 family protein [Lentisphaerota bacterium]